MKRTVVYIDGFNLYFGLKSKGWNRYYLFDTAILISGDNDLSAAISSTRLLSPMDLNLKFRRNGNKKPKNNCYYDNPHQY